MIRTGWVAAAAIFLLVREGRADPRADALARQATALFQAGDYEGAAAVALKGYEISPDPRFLFNIARAYDKTGNAAEAARFYHRYLEASATEPALLQRASDALDRLEPKAPPPPPVVSPTPSTPAPPAPSPPPPPPAVGPPPSPPRPPVSVVLPGPPGPAPAPHTVSNLVTGAGIAAVLTGVGIGLWANATATEMHDSLDSLEKPRLRSEAYGRATAADITMGAGAALVVTGLVLRLTSHSAASPAVRVGLAGPSCTIDFSW